MKPRPLGEAAAGDAQIVIDGLHAAEPQFTRDVDQAILPSPTLGVIADLSATATMVAPTMIPTKNALPLARMDSPVSGISDSVALDTDRVGSPDSERLRADPAPHKLRIMDGRTSKWFETHRTIVMPAHCDQYGHMNVRHYAAIFDDAGWHMFAHAGVSLSNLNARGLGSVVATLTIDFHHEITAGQLALIRGAFMRVGSKSFEYALELYEADSMTHCATQKTVEVCFDTAKRKSVSLPGDVREKLVAMLADPVSPA